MTHTDHRRIIIEQCRLVDPEYAFSMPIIHVKSDLYPRRNPPSDSDALRGDPAGTDLKSLVTVPDLMTLKSSYKCNTE